MDGWTTGYGNLAATTTVWYASRAAAACRSLHDLHRAYFSGPVIKSDARGRAAADGVATGGPGETFRHRRDAFTKIVFHRPVMHPREARSLGDSLAGRLCML